MKANVADYSHSVIDQSTLFIGGMQLFHENAFRGETFYYRAGFPEIVFFIFSMNIQLNSA